MPHQASGFRRLKTRADLAALVEDQVKEGLHIEFKACDALRPEDGRARPDRIHELAKDVAAFANADGGQILFGVIEKQECAVAIDDGFSPSERYSPRWIEQVLSDKLRPYLPGLTAEQIDLENGAKALIVTIPKSYCGPHQTICDKLYYRRLGAGRRAMEDYEIDEARRRRELVLPLLQVTTKFQQRVLLQIVITNVGATAVRDVRVVLSDELKVFLEGRNKSHALLRGFKHIAAGQKLIFDCDVTHKLGKSRTCHDARDVCPANFSVGLEYLHPTSQAPLHEVFEFSFGDFTGAAARLTDAEALVEAIDRLGSQLDQSLTLLAEMTAGLRKR